MPSAAYNQDLLFFSKNAAKHPYFHVHSPILSRGSAPSFGGLLPYLFASMGMTAVGVPARSLRKCAGNWIADNGIMKGKDKPDYGRAVDMLTKAAIKEMIGAQSRPPVLSPIVVYFAIFFIAGQGGRSRPASAGRRHAARRHLRHRSSRSR